MAPKPKPAAKRAAARKPAAVKRAPVKRALAAPVPRQPVPARSGRELDFDDIAERARAEIDQEPIVLRFRGKEFALPAEMPIDAAVGAVQGDMIRVLGALFDDELDAFLDLKPSVNDVKVLIEHVSSLYGVQPGE